MNGQCAAVPTHSGSVSRVGDGHISSDSPSSLPSLLPRDKSLYLT